MEVPQSSAPSLPTPFDLLEPPDVAGFLRLSRPCCFVFPGGQGDSAFFAVDGFSVLVDGGSEPRPCFWKLVRRLDRVDALLLTQVDGASLAGVASLLRRKVAELDLQEEVTPRGGATVSDAHDPRLVSPEIGVVFLNAPQGTFKPLHGGVDGGGSDLMVILHCLEKLNITPEPLCHPPGPHAQPITLFQKFGVGRLELYVLSPAKGSKELDTALRVWPRRGLRGSNSSKGPLDVPLSCLASICALLVWHPADVHEKVVRVLFPGRTPQSRILEGLEKLKHLDFLRCSANPECSERDPKKGPGPGSSGKGCQPAHRHPAEREGDRKKNGPPKNSWAKVVVDANAKSNRQGGGPVKAGGGASGAHLKMPRTPNPARTEEHNTAEKDRPTAKLKKGFKFEVKREVWAEEYTPTGAPGKVVRKAPSGPKHQGRAEVGKKDGLILRGEAQKRGMKWKRSSKESALSDMAVIELHTNDQHTSDQHSNDQHTNDQHANDHTNDQHSNDQHTNNQHPKNQHTNVQHTNDQHTNDQHANNQHTDNQHKNDLHTNDQHANKQHTNDQHTNEQHTHEECTNKQQDGAQAGQEGEEEDLGSPEESFPNPKAGLGSPFIKTPRGVATFDLTPTEYRLLDGAYMKGSQRAGPEFGCPAGFPKGNLATYPVPSPQEKCSSFLLLSPLQDLSPETFSYSTPTPTTTPSLPAELSSQQSTKVDESLSVSPEKTLPPCQSLNGHASNHTHGPRQELSLPLREPQRTRPIPPTATPYIVDLCLVSPCEYKHFSIPQSQNTSLLAGPYTPNPKSDSVSQEPANFHTQPGLDTPPGMEDCPSSISVGLDSDKDNPPHRPHSPLASCSASLHVHEGGLFPGDPPLALMKDLPPVPPTPGACMTDPKNRPRSTQSSIVQARTHPLTPAQMSLRTRSGGGSPSTAYIPTHHSHRAPTSKPGTAGSVGVKVGTVGGAWMYVDLAYIPSGPASSTVDAEFFRRVRSSYYIISGAEPREGAVLRSILDALLEGKAQWPGKAQVTVIPTFDLPGIHEWYWETCEQQEELHIEILSSNNTVFMQDEVFPACKVEF